VTLSVQNGSSMPVTLYWIEQLPSFVTIFVHTGFFFYWLHVSNMVDTVREKKYQHIMKDLIHAVKHVHSEYAIFLENQHKQALLEEEEKKKKEQAEEAKRVEQRTSKCLHEQLAEQAQLETVQMAEQETARQLILEASKKLSEAVQETGINLQGAKVAQAMLSAGNEKLNASIKQLANIKHEKEKNRREKLRKLERTCKQQDDCWQCCTSQYVRSCCHKTKTSLKNGLCYGYTSIS